METAQDLVVIGGGPAGSTLATLAAKAGHQVTMLERSTEPRYRIGESLLPATINDLAPLLGVEDELRDAGYMVKRGATFAWGDNTDELWTLSFGPEQTQSGATAPTAFNVSRADFDEILLKGAERAGVRVLRGVRATDVHGQTGTEECPTRRVDLAAETDGCYIPDAINARIVANATGQMRLPVDDLNARQHSQFFRKVAVWGYWTGGGRLDAPLDGNVFFETLETPHGDAWVWYIPLQDGLTSVGVVAPRACMDAIRTDPRASLTGYLVQCPRITALLANATPADHAPYDEVRTCADYSYASEAFWAPGLVQVGDSACFVDVLLSSGVHLATYGALLAARSVNAVLTGQATEAHAMNEYESRLRQEFSVFYAGLSGLYDMDKSRDHYIPWLRGLLQNSNGVRMEWREAPGTAGGLNSDLLPLASMLGPEAAARNVAMMRGYAKYQLSYDGPPRTVPAASLPAIHNTLAMSEDRLGWIAPASAAPSMPHKQVAAR